MDRKQFRQQIGQRYIAGKALEGASADEIAKGLVDPVEQMNYVAGQASKGTGSDSGTGGVLLLVALIAFALLTILLKVLF